MRENCIHVSVRGVSSVKEFARDQSVLNHKSKYRVGKRNQLNYNTLDNVCGIHSGLTIHHSDSRWHRKSHQCKSQILYFWKWPDVNIYLFLYQYLTPGGIRGLYVRLRDTPDAMRPFLVDIAPSSVVLALFLVPRGPWDNSELCVHSRSLVRRL